jgi:hypothetical protein
MPFELFLALCLLWERCGWIELVTLTYERRKSNIQEFGLDHVLHYRPIQVIGKINYYSQFIHDTYIYNTYTNNDNIRN